MTSPRPRLSSSPILFADASLQARANKMGDEPAAVPVGIAPEGEHSHELMLATEGAAREAAGHDLRERGEIGRDAEVRLRTTGRVAETRDHLVEDEHHAVARRQRPELLEVTRDGRRRPGLAARGLEDDRGDVAALESDLDRLDVVGRADHDLLERRARHA